ncbi:MAG TPA: hypothetical protein ENJ08_00370 [Gammaproteobacteria bacterium]|nr:hypothetical protein [Gammaproteobacteria bacterium]
MAFTKAASLFLTDKPVALYLFLVFFTISLLPGAVHACGGSYAEWYDIGEPLIYDPDRASLKNSILIFQDFTRSLSEKSNPWLHFKEKGARYYSDITDALKKSDRHLIDGGSSTAHNALERTYKTILFPNINHGQYDSRELCGTRDIASLQHFVTLVINDNSVNDAELAKIFSIRNALSKSCHSKSALENTLSRLASPGNHYEMYLQATAYFYLKDYEKAGAAFTRLSKTPGNPLAEISSYLRGRTALFASQKNWPEWPDSFEGINRQDAMAAMPLLPGG